MWQYINNKYVCHYSHFLYNTDFKAPADMNHSEAILYIELMRASRFAYKIALRRANKIGGRKFDNSKYQNGISFKIKPIINIL